MEPENYMSQEKLSDSLKKDIRDIKKSLKLSQGDSGVIVYAFAVDTKYRSQNTEIKISTSLGDPLTHEVHDTVNDCYLISAYSHHEIGHIPVNYEMELEGSDWSEDVPLPFSVIKRHMTDLQKSRYNSWVATLIKGVHRIQYLQLSIPF